MYHTARFSLVAVLREDLDVAVPDDRGPGKAWMIRPAADEAPIRVEGAVPIRIGYARCSTATQELASQLEAPKDARCNPIFSEKIGTRVKVRPEFAKALTLAYQFKSAVPARRSS